MEAREAKHMDDYQQGDQESAGGAAMGSSDVTVGKTTNTPSLLKLGNKHFFDEMDDVKLSDVKAQLDSDSERDKLVAMKRLLAMVSRGRDVAAAFPDVVKNVISKNVELRKLVYMFLVHYAEVQPQEALLAINSLQKAMNDQNQLLRANALRCMSNIRVREIAQLVVLAVQKGSKDSSPYVRKTAALAVPKIMRLDARHTEQCIELIGSLLKDPSTMVLGAAVQAFLEVCPTRFDLIHPSFRRICQILPDIDEWSQVAVLSLLLRYGRVHFTNPDLSKRKQAEGKEESLDDVPSLDPDHRLTLHAAGCLLQSRNHAVVLAASVLLFYLSPPAELSKVAKPLVRLLHTNRETQYVALTNIASMASAHPQMFADQLAEFFICGSESLPTRQLKLEVLTHLASEQNITIILCEMREYTKDEDKSFVAAAIQAIGRCAAAIPEVADSCMVQLLQLMANQSQVVVAESVVVIKKIIQMNAHSTSSASATAEGEPSQKTDNARDVRTIKQLAKLLETITVPQARAAIVWLVGEYSEKVPQRAPDVLRCLAKSFADESDIVKLQVLTLATKLYLVGAQRSEDLLKYVLQLAKYDTCYDIRDRARLIRQLLFTGNMAAVGTQVRDAAKSLFLAEKPVPVLTSPSVQRQGYTLATLSHAVHDALPGYEPLPDFPEVMPDPSVRNTAQQQQQQSAAAEAIEEVNPDEGWGGEYDPEADANAAADTGAEDANADADDGWGVAGEYENWDATDMGEEQQPEPEPEPEPEAAEEVADDDDDDIWNPKPAAEKKAPQQPPKAKAPTKAPAPAPAAAAKKPSDPFDDLFGPAPTASSQSGSSALADMAELSSGFVPQAAGSAASLASAASAAAMYRGPQSSARSVLVKPLVSGGLSVEYAVCRKPSLYGQDVVTLSFFLSNTRTDGRPHCNVRIGRSQFDEGVKVIPFPEISELSAGSTIEVNVTVHFASFTKPLKFEISSSEGDFPVTLLPQPGDLVRPGSHTAAEFRELVQKLSGMYKSEQTVDFGTDGTVPDGVRIAQVVQEVAYVAPVPAGEGDDAAVQRFSAEAIPIAAPVLVVVKAGKTATTLSVAVHTENAVIGSLLLKQVATALKK